MDENQVKLDLSVEQLEAGSASVAELIEEFINQYI